MLPADMPSLSQRPWNSPCNRVLLLCTPLTPFPPRRCLTDNGFVLSGPLQVQNVLHPQASTRDGFALLHLDYKFLLDRLSGSFEQFDSHSGLHRQPHTMLALNEVGMFRACKPSDLTGWGSRRNAPDLHHHRRLALM